MQKKKIYCSKCRGFDYEGKEHKCPVDPAPQAEGIGEDWENKFDTFWEDVEGCEGCGDKLQKGALMTLICKSPKISG
jgi:hypothetical protein